MNLRQSPTIPWIRLSWLLLASPVSAGEIADAGGEGKNPAPQQLPLLLDSGKPTSRVPVRWSGGWGLVPVTINGKDAGWFKIATGWTTSSIDPEVVRRLGLSVVSITGFLPQDSQERRTGEWTFVRADDLRCGDASVASATLQVTDFTALSQLTKEAYGHPISGVLGWDLLSTLPFDLDPGTLSLTWMKEATPPPGATRTDLINRGGYPFAEAVLGDGAQAWMMVNTSGTHTMIDSPFAADHLEAVWNGRKSAANVTSYFVRPDDDNLEMPQVARLGGTGRWLDVECLGGRAQTPAKIHPEPNRTYGGMALGMSFLQKFRMVFDGPNSVLWTSPTPSSAAVAMARTKDPAPPAKALELALFEAIQNDDELAVRELLAVGVNRDRILGDSSPLSHAGQASARACAVALLEAGAKVSPLPDGTDRFPPLSAAINADDQELVRLFLKHGGDPNQPNRSGMLPLPLAARHGSPELFQILLSAAGVPQEPGRCLDLVVESCGSGNLAVVKTFMPKANIKSLESQSRKSAAAAALEGAVIMGHPEIVTWWFDNFDGVDPDVGFSMPPLLAAILPSRPEKTDAVRLELVQILLERGAKPNASSKGVSALLLASRHGSEAIVSALLAAGADPAAKDYKMRSAIHRAAEADQPAELLGHLLKAGIPFDEFDSNTELTPLGTYARHGNLAACKALLEAGAEPDKHTLGTGAALSQVLRNTHDPDARVESVVSLLLEHGATVVGELSAEAGFLFFTIDGGRPAILTRLAEQGIHMEKPMEINRLTPLMVAAAGSNVATVTRILELGGKPETLDRHGHSAVAHAAAAGRIHNLAALLFHGASPDAVAAGAVPPLCVAVELNQRASLRVLLEAGADVAAMHPRSGLTPLELAKARRDAAMVRDLGAAPRQ